MLFDSSSVACNFGVLVDSLFGFKIIEATFWKKWNLAIEKKLAVVFPMWIPVKADFAALTSRIEFSRKAPFDQEE